MRTIKGVKEKSKVRQSQFFAVFGKLLLVFLTVLTIGAFSQTPIPDGNAVAVWSNSPVKAGDALVFYAINKASCGRGTRPNMKPC